MLFAGVLLLLSLLQWQPVRSALVGQGVLPQQAGFSELAFTQPAALPKSPLAGGDVALAFTLTNHEGESRSYGWQGTLVSRCGAPLSQQGTLVVADGQQAAASVRFPVPRVGCSGMLSIRLLSAPQRISMTFTPVGGRS